MKKHTIVFLLDRIWRMSEDTELLILRFFLHIRYYN